MTTEVITVKFYCFSRYHSSIKHRNNAEKSRERTFQLHYKNTIIQCLERISIFILMYGRENPYSWRTQLSIDHSVKRKHHIIGDDISAFPSKTTVVMKKIAASVLLVLHSAFAGAAAGGEGTPLSGGIGMSLLGITLLLFPYCTPETYAMFGYVRTTRLGRGMGILVILFGLWMLWKAF